MKAERLKTVAAEVAVGTASFPRKKGKVRLKDRQRGRQKLVTCLMADEGESFTLSFEDSKAQAFATLRAENEGPLTRLTIERERDGWNRLRLTFPVGEEERFYGCGGTEPELLLNGKRFCIWAGGAARPARKCRKITDEAVTGVRPDEGDAGFTQPVFISSEKYFMRVAASSCVGFDFTVSGQVTVELRRNAPIYVGRADSYEALSELLAAQVGRSPGLPRWCHDGVILGMHKGMGEVKRRLALAREAGVAVAGIWCRDWCGGRETKDGYRSSCNWETDEELYPGLTDQIRQWREEGIHFLGYISPFLERSGEVYAYASEQGYCVKNTRGGDYEVDITPFSAAMVDLTNPAARQWMIHLIRKNMVDAGFSGWLADHGDYLPADAVLFSGEKAESVHNRWPALWADISCRAIRGSGRRDEILIVTNSGGQGVISRTSLVSLGQRRMDFAIDGGLAGAVPAALSLSMSGVTVAGSGVGGRLSAGLDGRTREFFLRSLEMNTFSPLLMTCEGESPEKNVQFDEDDDMLKALRAASKTHRALSDYLERCEAEAFRGIPMIRPLFYHYEDPAVCGEAYEYLLGRDILVAPVIEEGTTRRRVCFPEDTWIHIYTGEVYHGGTYLVQAPLGEPPIFIRKDAAALRQLLEIRNIR